MTAKTPVYELEYIVEGESARNARGALERNAKSIEAALILGGIAPPAAADLLAAVARIGNLEAAAVAPVAVPYVNLLNTTTGWSKFSTGWRGLRCWSQGRTVFTSGVVKNSVAISAGGSAYVGRIPVGFRPTVETEMFVSLANASLPIRWDVTVDGMIQASNNGTATIPASSFCPINMTWSKD